MPALALDPDGGGTIVGTPPTRRPATVDVEIDPLVWPLTYGYLEQIDLLHLHRITGEDTAPMDLAFFAARARKVR